MDADREPLATPFSATYYRDNLALMQRSVRDEGLGAVAIFDPESIFWLTGYRSIGYFTFQCVIVKREGGPIMVSRRVNKTIAERNPNIATFVGVEDTQDSVAVLAEALTDHIGSADPIGLETNATNLSVQSWQELSRSVPNELRDWGGVIERARMIKTPEQLECMHRASRAAVAGLDAAVKAIAPGRTENDLAAAMLHGATAAGSEYTRVPLVVAGKATGICFTTWERRPIRRGDVVLLEAAANINRYHAIIARTCIAGPATPEHRRWSDLVIESLDRAIAAVRPGATSGEVDAACRSVYEKAGVGGHFDHRTAYSIGIGFPPNWAEGRFLSIRPGDSTVLEPGMTFHIVPSLFFPDFGVWFSESVAVAEDGCEILTDYPRRLVEVDF